MRMECVCSCSFSAVAMDGDEVMEEPNGYTVRSQRNISIDSLAEYGER